MISKYWRDVNFMIMNLLFQPLIEYQSTITVGNLIVYIYDLYGFSEDRISDAREIIENRLDIKLETKESSYHGGLYYRYKNNKSESCILKSNIDPFDGETVELDYPEYSIVFYVEKTERPEYFRERLLNENKFVLLQTRVL